MKIVEKVFASPDWLYPLYYYILDCSVVAVLDGDQGNWTLFFPTPKERNRHDYGQRVESQEHGDVIVAQRFGAEIRSKVPDPPSP